MADYDIPDWLHDLIVEGMPDTIPLKDAPKWGWVDVSNEKGPVIAGDAMEKAIFHDGLHQRGLILSTDHTWLAGDGAVKGKEPIINYSSVGTKTWRHKSQTGPDGPTRHRRLFKPLSNFHAQPLPLP